MQNNSLFIELAQDDDIPIRLRIEVYAMVALDVRPLGLIFLPVELPNGDAIGQTIDYKYKTDLEAGQNGSFLQRFRFNLLALGKPPVVKKKLLLRQTYISVVESLSSYKALYTWAEKLELKTHPYEVRPSIHEVYIFESTSVGSELAALEKERLRIREEAWAKATPYTPYSLLTYPEEQVPEYLEKLGRLLGYPECCTKAYLKDRIEGVDVENRAAYDLQSLAEEHEVEPWAYFVKDFFPCHPTCAKAAGMAKKAYERLQTVSPELAQCYMELLRENQDRVLSYPVTISEHLKKIEKS